MKKQIRKSVFETNSSSVHTMTICSRDDYDRWINGELFYNPYAESFSERKESCDSMTKDQYENDSWDSSFEIYEKNFTTNKGDEYVIFGRYGHD